MADYYRSRSRRSETPSSSSSGGNSSPGQYQATAHPPDQSYAPGQYSYYPSVPSSQHVVPSSHGHYSSPSPPQLDESVSGYGHHRKPSSGPTRVAPRHSSHPAPVMPEFTSERAPKRQRATTAPDQTHIQAQWSNAPAHGYPQSTSRRNQIQYQPEHGSRKSDRASSGSSGYNSPPSYPHGDPHDPYGQQIYHQPSLVPGPSADMYDTRHSRRPSSDDEYAEHGPTELPPRTFSGKSPYDPPKKPGKIPGSAMDYLPILEARFERLETAIDKYVDYRGKRAISNSILPGMDSPGASSSREGSSSSSRNPRGSARR